MTLAIETYKLALIICMASMAVLVSLLLAAPNPSPHPGEITKFIDKVLAKLGVGNHA
jgi:hypothetical protein